MCFLLSGSDFTFHKVFFWSQQERFSFGALFRDENDINEKAIIGFMSFALMVVFGACDLITAFWDMDLKISDTIYTSFVVVTLGAFGISEAGKAFSKQ